MRSKIFYYEDYVQRWDVDLYFPPKTTFSNLKNPKKKRYDEVIKCVVDVSIELQSMTEHGRRVLYHF